MKKRKDRADRYEEIPQDQFEAYGEYSYTYQHQDHPQGENDVDGDFDGYMNEVPYGQAYIADGIAGVKERKRKEQKSMMIRLIVLLVCVGVGLLLLQESAFRLKTVFVVGNKVKTPQQITQASGLVQGRSIFTVTEEEVKRNLSRDHTIEFIRMQKEYPSTIYLYINERQSIAGFQWLGIQYTLDEQGMVMDESNDLIPPESLPMLKGLHVTNIQVGQQLELQNMRQMNAYQAIMSELHLQMYSDQILEINLSDPDNLYLMMVDGITVRLGGYEYPRAKIGALRTDMAYLRQLGKTTGILDVSIPEDAKYTPD